MVKMSEAEIRERLPQANGWERIGDELVRTWQFPSTRRALEFVGRVADEAEALDHHLDIILSYRSVRVELSTHAEGGISARDFELAERIGGLKLD
ncbi:MAG: 4a-hydroxytetrahydrobiopterin dehydratase [Isosphaeraceae bacterium]